MYTHMYTCTFLCRGLHRVLVKGLLGFFIIRSFDHGSHSPNQSCASEFCFVGVVKMAAEESEEILRKSSAGQSTRRYLGLLSGILNYELAVVIDVSDSGPVGRQDVATSQPPTGPQPEADVCCS